MKWNFLYQITAASRTPGLGATAPRSPFSLSSTEFVDPPSPSNKIPGYATVLHKLHTVNEPTEWKYKSRAVPVYGMVNVQVHTLSILTGPMTS